MPQQLVLTPLGIITEPNKLGQIPAGAFSSASGVVMRQPGKVHGVVTWSTRYTLTGTDAGTTCAFVVATGKYALVFFNRTAGWAYDWVDLDTNTSAFGVFTLATSEPSSTAVAQSIDITRQPGFCAEKFQGQLLVNLHSRLVTSDSDTPTTSALATLRPAGLPPPGVESTLAFFSQEGTAIPTGKYTFIVGLTRRKLNGREYVSRLSPVTMSNSFAGIGGNGGSPITTDVYANVFLLPRVHRAGDIVELYRTRCADWESASPPVPTRLSQNAGSEYLLFHSRTLTAADIVAGSILIRSGVSDDQLGRAAYTNQALAGLGAENQYPPALEQIATYKGHLLGFGPTYPPTKEIKPGSSWNEYLSATGLSAAVETSIGAQFIPVTFSSGSNTLTALAADIANVVVGQSINSTAGGFNVSGFVTARTATTLTFSGAAAGASGADSITVRDRLELDGVSLDMRAMSNLTSSVRLFINGTAMLLSPVAQPQSVTINSQFLWTAGDAISMARRFLYDSRLPMTIRATRGANYVPQLPEYTATPESVPEQYSANAVVWSEQNQPESWPGVNIEHFSAGQPHAVVTTRDAVICFYSDGIWRFSGTGGSAGAGYDWRADQIASGVTISGSQCACVLNDVVYAYTSEGFVGIDSAGTISRISHGRIGDQLSGPPWNDGPYNNTTAMFVCADEEHSEIIIRSPETAGGAMWRYNTITDTFVQTTSHDQPTHAAYSRHMRNVLVVGKTGASTWTLRAEASVITATGQVQFQPIYTDNPFSLKHWQQFDVGVEATSAVITASFNGVTDVSRTATDAGLSENARVGFAIPRNAPAIANTICPGLTINPDSGDFSLQGFALQFEDLTDQRNKR